MFNLPKNKPESYEENCTWREGIGSKTFPEHTDRFHWDALSARIQTSTGYGGSSHPLGGSLPDQKGNSPGRGKVILENIIPRYGMVNTIDSDRGPHIVAQTLQNVIENLGIKWRLHTPWHPQSSGRVEWMNKTLKNCID